MAGMNIGSLLLYHGKCAALTAFNGEKLEIRIEGGATKSVRPKDVEYLHPGPVSALPPPVPECSSLAETAELIGSETLPFEEFAELLFSEKTPGAFFGAWQVLQQKLYFTGSVEGGVTVRAQEEIAKDLAAREEKNAAKKAHEELLERIRNNAVTPEDRNALKEIEQVAYNVNPSSRLMRELGIEALPEKAHELLLKLGVWDESVNPYPLRNGIDGNEPECEVPPVPEEAREDLTFMRSYAIDNAGSTDPDDAFSFDNGLLWVHIADPAAVVTPASPLDMAARSGGENLYLPEKTLHMLPAGMTERFGLGLAEKSPALSFAVKIGEDGNAVLEKTCLSFVHVERHTYESAGKLMDQEDLQAVKTMLERFRAAREKAGAIFIRLPEADVFVRDKRVEIVPVEITPERELVANAMLAAGAAVGRYAVEHDIAMPFAAQAKPEEVPDETESMSGMYLLRKCCSAGFLSGTAQPHSGLGLSAYVRVTSPLRRYADLLAHQQLRKILKGETPFSFEEIEERFTPAEKEAVVRRKTERISNEYWTLVYLKQHPDWTGEAVVVDHPDDRTAFLIPSLAYEFKMRGFHKLRINEIVNVKLQSVDPARLTSHFTIVQGQ